ncbi:MAG: hypothetical protein HQK73_11800 [Desulfamplus sp.]|nr:hypothetical protein [Desulfamplus sp.]MBF0413797.1 hypothetical protein [Desulfamplus sp.]
MDTNCSTMRLNPILYFKNIFIAITVLFLISGCSNSLFSGSAKKSGTPKASQQSNAVYYDFDDILVPRDMKIDDGSTVVVSTPGHTSGIITLKGRIDKDSLLKFFNSNMQKDNWSIISQIRSPTATILIFQKASRWAVISLRDREYYTYAEIGVAPSFNETSSYSNMPSGSSYNSGAAPSTTSGNSGKIESENLFE